MPRATFFQNVGVIQDVRRKHPVGDQVLFVELTHAYFPKWAFDEVIQQSSWTFGRKGNAYVALYSQNPTSWSTEAPDYELVAPGMNNVWLVELGSQAEQGSFSSFVSGISAASVTFSGGKVRYQSPSVGAVEVGESGPMTVKGLPVDIGPYERFDNPYSFQSFGSQHTTIAFEGRYLELDFPNLTRLVHY